ncbi:MAG: hypothetical protein ACOX3T_08345 [Bdellovibrionota bacterium]
MGASSALNNLQSNDSQLQEVEARVIDITPYDANSFEGDNLIRI